MIVVADAGPIHYLILTEAIEVLKPLYQRVVVPRMVPELALAAARLVRSSAGPSHRGLVGSPGSG